MSARAERAIAQARFPVDVVKGGAESLPFEDHSFDTAVSTLVLCTVSDPMRVLAEIRRVLRPDGRFLVLEHGLSGDAGVAKWQHRLNRIQNVVACGCNLDRDIGNLITAAGFRFEEVRQFYAAKMPRTHSWMTEGTARVT